MKRYVKIGIGLIVIATITLLLGHHFVVRAAPPSGTVLAASFEAVDEVSFDIERQRFHIAGIAVGANTDSEYEHYYRGTNSTFSDVDQKAVVDNCLRMALLAQAKPTKYVFSIYQSSYDGYNGLSGCGLTLNQP